MKYNNLLKLTNLNVTWLYHENVTSLIILQVLDSKLFPKIVQSCCVTCLTPSASCHLSGLTLFSNQGESLPLSFVTALKQDLTPIVWWKKSPWSHQASPHKLASADSWLAAREPRLSSGRLSKRTSAFFNRKNVFSSLQLVSAGQFLNTPKPH